MDTINLVSHPGSRARCGFGPREFPLLDGSDISPVAELDGVLYVEFDGALLQGFPIEGTLGDADLAGGLVSGATLAFDGDLPLQGGGCSDTPLWFSATHVFRRRWDRVIPVIQSYRGEARFVYLNMPSAAWVRGVADTMKEDRIGTSVNLCGPWSRTAWTIFEFDQIPADVGTKRIDITIHDEATARRWFDPSAVLDAAIKRSEKSLQALIEKLTYEAARAKARLDQVDAPLRVNVGPHASSQRDIDMSEVDRLCILRWLRDLFDLPVGETFDPRQRETAL